MKAFDKQSDPNLIKRAIDAGLSSTPGLSIAWAVCKALYGNALELRQQRALEWVEMIRGNPAVFSKEVLESVEFQDGFIVALEDYLKLRALLKRAMARKIFTEFTRAKDKEQFELERYNMTLRQISPVSLRFMAYIKTTVELKRQERVEKTMEGIDFSNAPMQLDQTRPHIEKQHPLSHAYKDIHTSPGNQVWLPDKPNPLYPTIQGSIAITIKDSISVMHEECLAELTSLGILSRIRYTTPVSDTDPQIVYHDIWDYTDYGKSFANFLEQTH
jgi:hypothetical protein